MLLTFLTVEIVSPHNAFFPLFSARLEEVLLLNSVEKTRRKCQKEQWEIFAAS